MVLKYIPLPPLKSTGFIPLSVFLQQTAWANDKMINNAITDVYSMIHANKRIKNKIYEKNSP